MITTTINFAIAIGWLKDMKIERKKRDNSDNE